MVSYYSCKSLDETRLVGFAFSEEGCIVSSKS